VGVDIAEGMRAVARRDDPQLDVRPGGGRLAPSVWDVGERTRLIGLVRDAVFRAGEARSPKPPVAVRLRVDGGHERLAVAKVGSGRGP
jgi:hypothetical protein